MKIEAWIFLIVGLFYVPVVLVYFAMGGEPVGVGGLTLAAGLGLMVGAYLFLVGRKITPRPEDDLDGLVAENPGIQGEFSPWSWWPLPLAGCAALVFLGLAVGYWVAAIGAVLGVFALCGWVYEYYRGPFAH